LESISATGAICRCWTASSSESCVNRCLLC
jgi:hypothetical protein